MATLVNFNNSNGANPYSGLVQGRDGNFYGTTESGGSAGAGSIFRYEPGTSENVTFGSASDIPILASSYSITGSSLNVILNYAPSLGDVLTVVQNTGASPISGTFTNLPDGSTITASYNGTTYAFIASYSGGSGYDLTLTSRLAATVTLGNLAAIYNGTPKSATATTNPPGLNVTFTYNGSNTPPTKSGKLYGGWHD